MGESQTPHPPAGFAGSPGCFNPPDPNISFSFPFLPFVCPSSSSSSSSFKYSFYVQRFKKEKKVKGFFFFFPVLFCWPTGHFAHRLGHFLPHRHHLARPPTSGQRGPLLGQAPPFPGEDVSLHRSSSRAHICRSTHDKEDGAGGHRLFLQEASLFAGEDFRLSSAKCLDREAPPYTAGSFQPRPAHCAQRLPEEKRFML